MSKRMWMPYCTISTLLGCFAVCLPDGGLWGWGNMSVYVLSYMRMAGVDGRALESPWLLSLFIIFETVGMLMASGVASVLGRRLTLLLGIFSLDGGLFLNYFTVQISMVGFNITGGAFTGLGYGLIYSMAMLYVIDLTNDNNEGLFFAIMSIAMTTGGSLSIELVSHYTNPDNKTPNLDLGLTKFFTQIDVLTRVPQIYLVLGGVSLFLHIVGFALICDKPNKEQPVPTKKESSDENTCLQKDFAVAKYKDQSIYLSNIDDIDQSKMAHAEDDAEVLKESPLGEDFEQNHSSLNTDANNFVRRKNSRSKTTVTLKNNTNTSTITHEPNFQKSASKEMEANREIQLKTEGKMTVRGDYLPSQMLQDKTFYILWIVLIFNDFGYATFVNYYKLFGQLFIHNDHSLANVGTGITISVASTRVAWGIMIDKLGIKWGLILFSAAFSWLFSFYYFTSLLDPWYYYVCSILLACIDSGLHANFSVATLKYFGAKHFAFNMGVVMSSTILLNLAAPTLLQLLLYQWGWFVLFITNAIVNLISLPLICLGLPTV